MYEIRMTFYFTKLSSLEFEILRFWLKCMVKGQFYFFHYDINLNSCCDVSSCVRSIYAVPYSRSEPHNSREYSKISKIMELFHEVLTSYIIDNNFFTNLK